MALSDALYELAVRWDREISPVLGDEDGAQLERLLEQATADDDVAPLAEVIATVARHLPDDNPVIEALDRPRYRTGPGHEVTSLPTAYLRGTELGWSAPNVSSDETFLALVLSRRVQDRHSAAATRVAAHRTTLKTLAAQQPNSPTPLLRVDPDAKAVDEIVAHGGVVLGLRPDEAFLDLPSRYRTPSMVGELRRSIRLIPAFQFASADTSQRQLNTREIAARVNQILDASNDPWGAASWWATMNAWLRAAPVTLIGTEREPEIEAAAHEVASDAW
jgi:hypothetical protein